MKLKYCFIALFLANYIFGQNIINQIDSLMNMGEFSIAKNIIRRNIISETTTNKEKVELKFREDLMERILLDFNKTDMDVKNYIKNYIPNFSDEEFSQWKDARQIEYMNIDGIDRYFHSAARNFFRINPDARKIFEEKNRIEKDGLETFLERYIPKVMNEIKVSKSNITKPKKIKLKYSVTVPANTIPAGEIIRCWLPFPKEIENRQTKVILNKTNVSKYILSANESPHRTIYLEKKTEMNKETVFMIELSLMSSDFKKIIKLNEIKSYNVDSELYKEFTSENFPHIMFTKKLKSISEEIIGEEKNPLLKAKKIYKWINDNIPWASAREYSTINNIPEYCILNKHGDCGIQSLLFITLCRLNGIPAKWQSGWMLHPGEVNLHDWAEIYFEGIGWLPVDQSFGLLDLNDEDEKWFFFGGIDAYHLIVNDDISKEFFPTKIYPRSETVDFQRGELEWRGGNLYFDKWDYHMDVEYEE